MPEPWSALRRCQALAFEHTPTYRRVTFEIYSRTDTENGRFSFKRYLADTIHKEMDTIQQSRQSQKVTSRRERGVEKLCDLSTVCGTRRCVQLLYGSAFIMLFIAFTAKGQCLPSKSVTF